MEQWNVFSETLINTEENRICKLVYILLYEIKIQGK